MCGSVFFIRKNESKGTLPLTLLSLLDTIGIVSHAFIGVDEKETRVCLERWIFIILRINARLKAIEDQNNTKSTSQDSLFPSHAAYRRGH